jgi:hypothetical protein
MWNDKSDGYRYDTRPKPDRYRYKYEFLPVGTCTGTNFYLQLSNCSIWPELNPLSSLSCHPYPGTWLSFLSPRRKKKGRGDALPATLVSIARRRLLLGLLRTNDLQCWRLPVLLLPGGEPFSRRTQVCPFLGFASFAQGWYSAMLTCLSKAQALFLRPGYSATHPTTLMEQSSFP